MNKSIKVEQHGGAGMAWLIGWLFSIGYLKLGFFKGLFALIVWPYFIGAHLEEAGDLRASAPAELEQDESGRD